MREIALPHLTLFLDDGGVMNDNRQRGPQWQHLVGEYFVPRLGGTYAAWREANRIVANRLFESANLQARMQAAADYKSFDRAYMLAWLRDMCELVSVPAPSAEHCIELAYQATAYIVRRVYAAIPGAAEAIRTLHRQGYPLHTASTGSSADLAAILEGMEVRDYFGRLYGPDLINTFKNGPLYYQRIFDDLGIEPANALVIDDSPHVLQWAAKAGAQTVLVSADRDNMKGIKCISSLAELPEMLEISSAEQFSDRL